jgi:hypothetical protein
MTIAPKATHVPHSKPAKDYKPIPSDTISIEIAAKGKLRNIKYLLPDRSINTIDKKVPMPFAHARGILRRIAACLSFIEPIFTPASMRIVGP